MSIDVFGRHSKRAESTSRDLPGIGFKVTSEGHYDMNNKRLCKVAEAQELNDAVNLNMVQHMIQRELQTIYDVVASLRTEVVNNNMMIKTLENSTENLFKNAKTDAESIQKLVYRNSELISQVDNRLNALKNGR